jgi:transcriptional regulator with XRE-family HTH domain
MQPATLIKRARQAAGLTQAELAERARMKQPEIARLERRGANPRLSTLRRVVAATGHRLKLELDGDAGIDETLIAASLRETPTERLREHQRLLKTAQQLGGLALRASGS